MTRMLSAQKPTPAAEPRSNPAPRAWSTRCPTVLAQCCTLVSAWILAALPASACKYNVRDAGFVDWNPQPYELYCFVDGPDSGEFTNALRHNAAALFLDANIDFQIVDASQNPSPEAMRHALGAGLVDYPGFVLVSSADSRLRISLPPGLHPSPTAAWDLLEPIVTSPARETLLQSIVDAYAVVLLVEGPDPTENRRVQDTVDRAVERIVGLMDKLPKTVKRPPVVQTITTDQARQESVLLWSLGIETDRRVSPQVAVLYGRGRRIGPTFAAPVSEESLYQALAILGQDCECSLDRSWMTGPTIPAAWSAELQRLVQLHAGFDAENPLVKTEISRIMARGPSSSIRIRPVGLPDTGVLDLDTFGYNEISIEEIPATPAPNPPPASVNPENIRSSTLPLSTTSVAVAAAHLNPEQPATQPDYGFTPALITLAALSIGVVGISVIVLWRGQRSS